MNSATAELSGMAGECFQCVQPASDRYTLNLESSTEIEDVFVCEECLSDFRETDWIDVHKESG